MTDSGSDAVADSGAPVPVRRVVIGALSVQRTDQLGRTGAVWGAGPAQAYVLRWRKSL